MSDQARELLADPRWALPRLGKIFDKKTSKILPYDPQGLTVGMQLAILDYFASPPRDPLTGQVLWENHLKSRQTGASTSTEYAAYCKTSWNPGWSHVCIADNRDRAHYLHQRVQLLHHYWPEDYRAKTSSATETRQLSFRHGGSMSVLSGKASGVGLGMSPNSLHISELPFWEDGEGALEKLIPSMLTQDEALILNESTPASADEPSADFWRQSYFDGKLGKGRWRSKFWPYWDGLANARPWNPDDKFTVEELRLLEVYGKAGLRPDNLAFRRFAMDTMPRLSKHPELFAVWYPFDDRSCWATVANDFLSPDLLNHRDHRLVDDSGKDLQVFEEPMPNAAYVVGVDPAGWGGNHGAAVVLKVWADAGEEVVATYSSASDPIEVNEQVLALARKYNNAIVNIERNGVGAGCIQYMQAMGYTNLYYDDNLKPGVNKSSEEQTLGVLGEALRSTLTLRSGRLADQIVSYRGDMSVQQSMRTVILARGKEDKKRRSKEHWDMLSALCIALLGRSQVPARTKFRAENPVSKTFSELSWNELEEFRTQIEQQPSKRFRTRGRR